MIPGIKELEDAIVDIVAKAGEPIGGRKIERIVAGRYPDGDTDTFDVQRCVRSLVDAGRITRNDYYQLLPVSARNPPRPHVCWD